MSPKKRSKRQRDDNEQLRHYLEEASVNLRAAEMLLPPSREDSSRAFLRIAQKNLQTLYRKHGGIPH